MVNLLIECLMLSLVNSCFFLFVFNYRSSGLNLEQAPAAIANQIPNKSHQHGVLTRSRSLDDIHNPSLLSLQEDPNFRQHASVFKVTTIQTWRLLVYHLPFVGCE